MEKMYISVDKLNNIIEKINKLTENSNIDITFSIYQSLSNKFDESFSCGLTVSLNDNEDYVEHCTLTHDDFYIEKINDD